MNGAPIGVYRAFSPTRVWAITMNTFIQLVRMRVFYFLLIFSLIIVGISFLFVGIEFEQQLRLLKDVSFGAMRLFCGIFALVGTALLLPKDVEDRTLYTILAKPVPRLEYLLGKLAGVLVLILISLAVMTALFTVVLHLRGTVMLNQVIEMQEARSGGAIDEGMRANLEKGIRDQGASWSLMNGVWAIFLESAVAASVALLVSTFASSTLFTIVVGLVIYFIGHVQAIAREFWFGEGEVGVLARLLAAAISLVFPDFRQFSVVVDEVVGGNAPTFGLMLSLTGIAFFYLVIYNLVAYMMFSNKEL